jgi:NAD(P)-dependent dehydrogenase (short-subunit alcohol dehydrogenase family)
MIAQRSSLIVSTVASAFDRYMGNVLYDTSKAAIIRMMLGMAHDLHPYGVAAVAVAPGFMRTERVLAANATNPFNLSRTETSEYLGRAVAAPASDAHVLTNSDQLRTVGDLARENGLTDVDGSQPEPFWIAGGATPGAS